MDKQRPKQATSILLRNLFQYPIEPSLFYLGSGKGVGHTFNIVFNKIEMLVEIQKWKLFAQVLTQVLLGSSRSI